ncbi:MAG: hypothetical protein Q8L23_13840 [Caulobacter sp.]|nr:hypothetical protein [Caulobacter sp.]
MTALDLGFVLFVSLAGLGVDRLAAGGAGMVVAFAVRGGALRFGWSLPGFPGSPD